MLRKRFVAVLTAISLVAVPSVAMAAQAKTPAVSKLSIRSAPAIRNAAPVSQENNLRGAGVIISLLAVVGVVAVIVIATKSSSPS